MIPSVSEWWRERKAKHMLDELLKQSRASFRKTPRMESDLDLYSVYLDRSSVGEPAKRFEVNLYGGINGAWRVGSTIALLPLYKADGFSRKATKGHWRTFFSELATQYRLHLFLPLGDSCPKGVWYYSDGSTEIIETPIKDSVWYRACRPESPTSRVAFCSPEALIDPSCLSRLAGPEGRLVVVYTPEIASDLEIFAGGRSLQFDLFFLLISPERVYVTGPSIWGADKPCYNKGFHLQKEAELFSCHIPLGFPKYEIDREDT
ncbi:MAG: hypothetical protein BWX67_00068 [Thermotogae bacterium ADurb.Bin062]|jgi:hypothetical protein|nr:MAG: hypothetical protein BWX67_00068 [Thermotogota bacterium ADurb.Bin062]